MMSACAAYGYNAKNQSTSIKRAGGSAQTQAYAGASQFERLEKQNGAGTYTQFGESLLGMLIRKEGNPTYYTRLPSGELLSQRTPAGSNYYLSDGLGTIIAMSDDTGAVVARYSYDPYGQVLSESGPYNPWRFKSGYQSQTTDLYKFGQRWYDPSTGRWTQADPLERPTKPGDWTVRIRRRRPDQPHRFEWLESLLSTGWTSAVDLQRRRMVSRRFHFEA
jgi:RHS repeat-associated protein